MEEQQRIIHIESAVKFECNLFIIDLCPEKVCQRSQLGHTHLEHLQKLAGNNLSSHNPHRNICEFPWSVYC